MPSGAKLEGFFILPAFLLALAGGFIFLGIFLQYF